MKNVKVKRYNIIKGHLIYVVKWEDSQVAIRIAKLGVVLMSSIRCMDPSNSSSSSRTTSPFPYYFLNFVKQRTRMVPSLRPRKATAISSHKQPSFHILNSVASSFNVHLTRLFLGYNGTWCILECVTTSWLMSNVLGSIGKCRYPKIDGSLNSRLYVISFPTLMHLRRH
jgi:hypothetical protein